MSEQEVNIRILDFVDPQHEPIRLRSTPVTKTICGYAVRIPGVMKIYSQIQDEIAGVTGHARTLLGVFDWSRYAQSTNNAPQPQFMCGLTDVDGVVFVCPYQGADGIRRDEDGRMKRGKYGVIPSRDGPTCPLAHLYADTPLQSPSESIPQKAIVNHNRGIISSNVYFHFLRMMRTR